MDVAVNYVAVLLAAASSMVVGSLWYSKAMFLDKWAKLGKVKADPNWDKSKMIPMLGMTFVASLVTAFVLAHIAYVTNEFYQNSFFQDTVMTAVWLWLGLTGARMLTHDIFEGRPKVFTLINLGNELVTLLLMAIIIGVMSV